MENHDREYSYLEEFSTEQLKEIIRVDNDSPDGIDPELIDHVLEVIIKRERQAPTGWLPDKEEAWNEFETYYDIPEGDGMELYPCAGDEEEPEHSGAHIQPSATRRGRLKSALKAVQVAAAALAAVFILAVGAQGAGFNVFGAIGRWTDDVFHFVPASEAAAQDARNREYHDSIQAALDDLGIVGDWVPTWYPEGFEMGENKLADLKPVDKVHYLFTNGEKTFFIHIMRFHSISDINQFGLEKDPSLVEVYTKDSTEVYIFSNAGVVTAAWIDDFIMETISGNLSISDVKFMVDSIGR